MLHLPLPFMTAFFIVFILLQLSRYANKGLPPLTLVTFGFYALQSVLAGVNWGIAKLPPSILPSVAIVLPVLTWLTLNELAGRAGRNDKIGAAVGTMFLLAVINGSFLLGLPIVVDACGIVVYSVFGISLVWLGSSEDLEWIEDRPLHMILPIKRAFVIAGVILILSAGVDVAVAVDIDLNHRQVASALVGYSNLALLFVLVYVFFRVEGGSPSARSDDRTVEKHVARPELDRASMEIVEKLDGLMEETQLFRNENLSLSRIANKVGVPARQISMAVNSLRAMNVPQYVNTFRIRYACRLLEETETPVTEIVFAVGFTTKSNFHREFLRVTNVNPSEWRERSRRNGTRSTRNKGGPSLPASTKAGAAQRFGGRVRT